MRDMTERQFLEALARHSFKSEGFMGYYDLGIPSQHVAASIHNAGRKRRQQLAYLLAARERHLRSMSKEEPCRLKDSVATSVATEQIGP